MNAGRGIRFIVVALVSLAGLNACSAERSLPDDFLGTWYYTGSSGGITGDGAGDPVTGYIVITRDNTIERYDDDGSLSGTESFEVDRGVTIFSTDPMWILRGQELGIDRVIEIGDGTLAISDNVYDGYTMGYARSR